MLFTKKIERRIAKLTLLTYMLSTVGVFGLGGGTALAAEPVCTAVTLTSGGSTETAGYTEVNPTSTPLDPLSYSHTLASATVTQAMIPPWYDPTLEPEFAGSGAVWVSTNPSWPGGVGNSEGSSSLDQWRMYQSNFTIPANATSVTADVWYTADNAVALYHNSNLIDSSGQISEVYGGVPTSTPAYFMESFHNSVVPTIGANTINFVVRNWGGDYTQNPTGLLFKAVVHYCMPAPVVSNDVTVTVAKFVDGALATASTSKGNSFPMTSSWNATNTGAVSADFVLGAESTPVPYQMTTIPLNDGASFNTHELMSGAIVGNSCASGTPFAVVGYTVGNSMASATLATVSTTSPTLTNLSSNKYIIVWNATCPTVATTTPGTGSLTVKKVVSGGTAASSDFMIHVMNNGVEASGSPQVGTTVGSTYTALASSTYSVSETGTAMTNYTHAFSGDCNASGTVAVMGSSTKTCTITNTFVSVSTTTPTTIKVHVVKYLDGVVANATTSGGYFFPMSLTSQAVNQSGGVTTTAAYVLGMSVGGATNVYGADTLPLQSPAYFTTSEVTDGTSMVLPIGGVCATTSGYRLKGYSSSNLSFADAAVQTLATSAPVFMGLMADKYIVVWNETCTTPVTPPVVISPKAEKVKILAELKVLSATTKHVRERNDHDRNENKRKNNDNKVLTQVIGDIKASLKNNLWVTDTRLNDRKGDKVFDAEQRAVQRLIGLYYSERSSVSKAVLLDIINRLIADDRALAVAAITDAVAQGGIPQNIVNANMAIIHGDASALLHDGVNAIGYYQDAWGFAVTSF